MQREKVCAVIGLARAGVPSARFLASRGAQVIGYDNRALEQLGEDARALRELGVELKTGDHGFAGLEECTTIVLSPGLKIHHEPLKSVLADCEARGAEVIGELELAARHCPAPMIAVTGTKGKSTTVKLITEMLQACGVDALRAGNTGTPLIAELPNLSPQSWAVVEVSSFQLERAPTFKPRIAVLLNLLADHQDYHPTLEQYWATKLKIFARQDEGDVSVFNLDDERVNDFMQERGPFADIRKQLKSQVFDSSAKAANGESGWSWVCRQNDYLGFLQSVKPGIDFAPVIAVDDVPLRGQHNLSNVAAAMLAVHSALGEMAQEVGYEMQDFIEFEAEREAIAQAIRNFQSLPHRLEVVGQVNGVTFVNDSQATIPEAAIKAMQAFPKPVTLIAGGRAKLENEDAFDELGQAVVRDAHLLITIGEAAERIADAAKRASYPQGYPMEKIIIGKTLTEAVEKAIIGTPSGGTIVLSPACASFDQFASFEARGEAFREIVRQKQQEN